MSLVVFSLYILNKDVHHIWDQKVEPATYPDGKYLLKLLVKCDLETRGDIIINHLDVIYFVYLIEGVITKSFIPKKVTNLKAVMQENRKVIVTVSRDTEEYTPFSVPTN